MGKNIKTLDIVKIFSDAANLFLIMSNKQVFKMKNYKVNEVDIKDDNLGEFKVNIQITSNENELEYWEYKNMPKKLKRFIDKIIDNEIIKKL